MKRSNARIGFVVIFAAALVVSMAGTAQAEGPSCSLARAAGHYGFTDNGTVVGIGPRSAVGIFTLDSKGNVLNGKATSSLNGVITVETFSGTYTVNSDCTGTLSVVILPGPLNVTANLAWDDNLRQLRGLFTSADGLLTVITIDARKMFPREE